MPDPIQELLDHYRASDVRGSSPGVLTASPSRSSADPVTLDISSARVSLELPGPPTHVWRASYIQAKIEIESEVNLRLTDAPRGSHVTLGTSLGFETLLSEAMELNLDFDLNVLDLREACERGDVRQFGNQILGAIGLERQWELCHGIEASIGVGWDEHFCLLQAGIEGSDIRFELPLEGSGAHIEVRIPTGVTVKLGLTPRGWAVLLRRFGAPIVRRIAGAIVRAAASGGEAAGAVSAAEAEAALATGAGGSLAAFAGIALVSTELGLLSRDLVVWICRQAWEEGLQIGQEHAYARAYVYTVYYGRPLENSPSRGVVPAMNRGYRRAQADIRRHGQEAVQASLQQHFLGGRTIERRPDGVPVSDTNVSLMADRLGNEITTRRRGY